MNRGEIWWLEEPEIGRRPVCVLTRQEAIPVLGRVTVAPATRTVRGIPTEVAMGPRDGMPQACALSFDNVRTVPQAMLTERLTAVAPERLPELCAALDRALGCDP